MQRRLFLAAAAGAAATAAAAAAVAATQTPNATPSPGFSAVPGRSPHPGSSTHPSVQHFRHHTTGTETDLEHIHRHLERLIDMVEQYQSSGGHLPQAVGYLQQADTEIVAALSEASPSPSL